MFKVVLDTNILVSSLLTSGPPAFIVDLVAEGKIIPYYSDLILQEYRDVLSRKKFNFSPFNVTQLIHDIIRTGVSVKGKSTGGKTHDEDDQIFYDAAIEAQAILVTGNIRHFPVKPFVVTPAKFLSIYQSDAGSLQFG